MFNIKNNDHLDDEFILDKRQKQVGNRLNGQGTLMVKINIQQGIEWCKR